MLPHHNFPHTLHESRTDASVSLRAVAPPRWAAALPRPLRYTHADTTWQTCTICVHASPARPVCTRAVRALRVFALCVSAAHACVPVLCARCTCAVCRRHVRARAHACCACPCGMCASCAPSWWACGALVQRSTRSYDIRSSTSSISRGCTVLCAGAVNACVVVFVSPMLALRVPAVHALAVHACGMCACASNARVACTCCACPCCACLRCVLSCGVWCACAALTYTMRSSQTLPTTHP